MANFATIEDVESILQISISEADKVASVNRALKEATAIIKAYCHQEIEFVADDVLIIDSPGSYKLTLKELPVVSVSSVTENGTLLVEGTDYKLGEAGVLYRIPLWKSWAYGVQTVRVVYSHGYETIPDDIVAIAARIASRVFQAGLRSSSDNAVIGVSSKSLGDYSVSYGSDQGGGQGEGIMGVSGARTILRSERDILDRKYVSKRWYSGL